MSVLDVVTVVVFGVLIALLVRAAYVLGRNPHQQIREHERLAGNRFPAHVPFHERVRRINIRGMSPTDPHRVWIYPVIAASVFLALLWLR